MRFLKDLPKDLSTFFFVFCLAISVACLVVEIPTLFAYLLGNELWPNATMQAVALGMITPPISLLLCLYRPGGTLWRSRIIAPVGSDVLTRTVADIGDFVSKVQFLIKRHYTDGVRVTIFLASILVWFVSLMSLQDVYDEEAGNYLILGAVSAFVASSALLASFWYLSTTSTNTDVRTVNGVTTGGIYGFLQEGFVVAALAIVCGGVLELTKQFGMDVPRIMLVPTGLLLGVTLWYLLSSHNVMRPGYLAANAGSGFMGFLVSVCLLAHEAGAITTQEMQNSWYAIFFFGVALFCLGVAFQWTHDNGNRLISRG